MKEIMIGLAISAPVVGLAMVFAIGFARWFLFKLADRIKEAEEAE